MAESYEKRLRERRKQQKRREKLERKRSKDPEDAPAPTNADEYTMGYGAYGDDVPESDED